MTSEKTPYEIVDSIYEWLLTSGNLTKVGLAKTQFAFPNVPFAGTKSDTWAQFYPLHDTPSKWISGVAENSGKIMVELHVPSTIGATAQTQQYALETAYKIIQLFSDNLQFVAFMNGGIVREEAFPAEYVVYAEVTFIYRSSYQVTPWTDNYSMVGNGIDQYGIIGLPTLSNLDTYTISYWAKFTGSSSFGRSPMLVCKGSSNHTMTYEIRPGNKLRFQQQGAGSETITSTTVIDSDLGWFHCLVTRETSTLKMYINGALEDSEGVGASSKFTEASGGYILSNSANADFWEGNIDELTYWTVGMNNAEVAELYKGGEPFDPRTHSLSAGVQNYIRFGDGSDAYPTAFDYVGNLDVSMINMSSANFVEDTP